MANSLLESIEKRFLICLRPLTSLRIWFPPNSLYTLEGLNMTRFFWLQMTETQFESAWLKEGEVLVHITMVKWSRSVVSDPTDCSLPGPSVHGFSRRGHWSGSPVPSPMTMSRARIQPGQGTRGPRVRALFFIFFCATFYVLVSFSLIHGKQNGWNWVSLHIEKPHRCPNSISFFFFFLFFFPTQFQKYPREELQLALSCWHNSVAVKAEKWEQQRLSPQEKGHYTQKRGCGTDRTMMTSVKSPVGHCAWSLELLSSCPVMSNSVWPHELKHARPPCPSPPPEICPVSCPLHQWAIQPSHPLSSLYPPAFSLSQHWRLLQWVSFSHQMTKILEFQLQHPSFQWVFRVDFP